MEKWKSLKRLSKAKTKLTLEWRCPYCKGKKGQLYRGPMFGDAYFCTCGKCNRKFLVQGPYRTEELIK